MSLPPSLKSRYYIDGYYAPVKIFTNEEITKVYKEYQKYVNKFGNNGVLEGDYRFRVHLLAKWAHDNEFMKIRYLISILTLYT